MAHGMGEGDVRTGFRKELDGPPTPSYVEAQGPEAHLVLLQHVHTRLRISVHNLQRAAKHMGGTTMVLK